MINSELIGKRRFSMRYILLMVLAFSLVPVVLEAQSSADKWFNQGLEAFQWNKPGEAVVFFEKAVQANPRNDEYLLYLGISCHSLGQWARADKAYSRGIALQGPRYERLMLNRGNLRAFRGELPGALEDYSLLISRRGGLASAAMLNRANLQLNSKAYEEALDDYSSYLALEPFSPQRSVIEQLIGLLSEHIYTQEERARLEEENRLAMEAERAARLESLRKSLEGSGSGTTNIGAGSEDIHEDFEDSALED